MPDKSLTRRMDPPRLVFLSLLLGIATGIFFGEMVAWLQILGDIFIKLLQVTVIPFISVSLITGIGSQKLDDVKALALKGGGILLLVWTIVVVVLLFIPLYSGNRVRCYTKAFINARNSSSTSDSSSTVRATSSRMIAR